MVIIMVKEIADVMEKYVINNEASGISLIVRKDDEIIYKNKWGYSDLESKKELEYNSIFRMMSMTKPVTAVGVLTLLDKGLLSLDDEVSKFIPQFKNMRVSVDERYTYKEGMKLLSLLPKLIFFKESKVKTVPFEREITIRDLLSHSSGLEQGIVGLITMKKRNVKKDSLKCSADNYSSYILDFHPGTGTGYSPLAGFDILARIIEVVSGMPYEEYLTKEIFEPLEMINTTFELNGEQKRRLVKLYKRKKENLIDVTNSEKDLAGFIGALPGYYSGSASLYSTLEDYEKFAAMLLHNGELMGRKILRKETVDLMHSELPQKHLEPDPGFVWGAGVKVLQSAEHKNSFATVGTYGWSGAYGTHFFISPEDNLSAVLMLNREDIGGSSSYISKKTEELVFKYF